MFFFFLNFHLEVFGKMNSFGTRLRVQMGGSTTHLATVVCAVSRHKFGRTFGGEEFLDQFQGSIGTPEAPNVKELETKQISMRNFPSGEGQFFFFKCIKDTTCEPSCLARLRSLLLKMRR